MRETEFTFFLSSQESALCLRGIFRDGVKIAGDPHWYPFWMFLFILKNPLSQVPGKDYDAVETERFNLCEWQYLGCNRAYLTAFSFVLMRLYFASFLGSLTSHTLSLLACQK